MKRINQVLSASVVALSLTGGAAMADPVNFLPADATVQFKYNNLESLITQEGQYLNGILNVSTINDTGGNPYWASGISDGTALTGRFDNLYTAFINDLGNGSLIIYFTGGNINLYNVASGSFKPTDEANPIPGQICPGGVCPTPWLSFDFVADPLAVDDPNTAFDESTATLVSTITAGGLSNPTGTGDGLLEITGGTAAFRFADGPGADMSLQSGLQACPGTGQYASNCTFNNNTWAVASFDPVVGQTVPEPSSLALLGLALAGLGAFARRSSNQAN